MTQGGGPDPLSGCRKSLGQGKQIQLFLAQGFPSPSTWSHRTFRAGRIFSQFLQLSNSLRAVGESQGSQPPAPSLPASGSSSWWDLSRTAPQPLVVVPAAATEPGMPNSIPE